MIYCERGKFQIAGSGAEICADLEMIIREVRNALSQSIGTEGAEKVIAKIIEESRKSDDEIEIEIRDMAKKVADKLLRDIFGDAKEGE